MLCHFFRFTKYFQLTARGAGLRALKGIQTRQGLPSPQTGFLIPIFQRQTIASDYNDKHPKQHFRLELFLLFLYLSLS